MKRTKTKIFIPVDENTLEIVTLLAKKDKVSVQTKAAELVELGMQEDRIRRYYS